MKMSLTSIRNEKASQSKNKSICQRMETVKNNEVPRNHQHLQTNSSNEYEDFFAFPASNVFSNLTWKVKINWKSNAYDKKSLFKWMMGYINKKILELIDSSSKISSTVKLWKAGANDDTNKHAFQLNASQIVNVIRKHSSNFQCSFCCIECLYVWVQLFLRWVQSILVFLNQHESCLAKCILNLFPKFSPCTNSLKKSLLNSVIAKSDHLER